MWQVNALTRSGQMPNAPKRHFFPFPRNRRLANLKLARMVGHRSEEKKNTPRITLLSPTCTIDNIKCFQLVCYIRLRLKSHRDAIVSVRAQHKLIGDCSDDTVCSFTSIYVGRRYLDHISVGWQSLPQSDGKITAPVSRSRLAHRGRRSVQLLLSATQLPHTMTS